MRCEHVTATTSRHHALATHRSPFHVKPPYSAAVSPRIYRPPGFCRVFDFFGLFSAENLFSRPHEVIMAEGEFKKMFLYKLREVSHQHSQKGRNFPPAGLHERAREKEGAPGRPGAHRPARRPRQSLAHASAAAGAIFPPPSHL